MRWVWDILCQKDGCAQRFLEQLKHQKAQRTVYVAHFDYQKKKIERQGMKEKEGRKKKDRKKKRNRERSTFPTICGKHDTL